MFYWIIKIVAFIPFWLLYPTIIKKEKKTAVLVTHDIYEAISMSDRIVVLSARPGHIKSIHTTEFKPNSTPFERRKTEKAKKLFDIIWQEIQNEKQENIYQSTP